MRALFIKLVLCFFVLPFFASCAHLPTGLKSEDALRKQVHSEWDAKVRNDWGAVYDLCVAAFKNEIVRDNFIKRCNLKVEEFSIKEVEILETGKKARAIINFKTTQMGFAFNMTAREEWLWEEGRWRLNLNPSIMALPFMKKS